MKKPTAALPFTSNFSVRLRFVLVLVAGFFLTSAFGQDFTPPAPKPVPEKKKPFWSRDKVYVGGGLGLQLGTTTMINVAPDIGYKITKKYSAGVGIRYIYLADNYYNYKLNIYGASVFNRFLITDYLFAHVEYELLNVTEPSSRTNFSLENVWVGGGYRQVAENSAFYVVALWNLNDTPYNPFPNPQIRLGFNVGL
jgi:hypothetical protein